MKKNVKTSSNYSNDTHWKWESRIPDGDAPVGRFGHTTTVIGSKFFLAGGTTGTSNYKGRVDGEELINELWCLDLSFSSENLHWERIYFTRGYSTQDINPMQRCHSAIAHDSKIMFFGGGPPRHTTNELHVLDTNSMDITLLEVSGRSPRPRQNHVVATMLDGSVMVLFGGCLARGNAEELGDTWVLDLDHGFKLLDGDLMEEEEEEEEAEEAEEDDDFSNMFAGELIRVQFSDGTIRIVPRVLFEYYQRLQQEGDMSDEMSDEEDLEEDDENEEKEQ